MSYKIQVGKSHIFFTMRRIRNAVLLPAAHLAGSWYHAAMFKPGLYRHYKGKDYIALGLATHSESSAKLVVYAPLYNDSGIWVRPAEMFSETVLVEGIEQARFAYIGEASPEALSHLKSLFNGLL